MGIERGERAEYYREVYGAEWVESAAEMRSRMSADQRERLDRLRSEQVLLLARGEPSPRLDPGLAACAAGGTSEVEERVAFARANRRLARRALGEADLGPPARPGAMDVLSLCSGIGGLDIDLRKAVPEARVVCYVEGAWACQAVLLGRMVGGVLDRAPIYGNLKSGPGRTPFDGRPWRGLVDLVPQDTVYDMFRISVRRTKQWTTAVVLCETRSDAQASQRREAEGTRRMDVH